MAFLKDKSLTAPVRRLELGLGILVGVAFGPVRRGSRAKHRTVHLLGIPGIMLRDLRCQAERETTLFPGTAAVRLVYSNSKLGGWMGYWVRHTAAGYV